MLESFTRMIGGRRGLRGGIAPKSRVPEVAALTMVHRSPVILRKWVDHYGKLLGQHNLFIISHGVCDQHAEVVAGCNYMVVPRDFSEDVARLKAIVLTRVSTALLSIYQGVVVGDADEMIVLDPAAGPNLRDYVLDIPDDRVLAPIGFHIIPEDAYYDGHRRATIEAPLLSQVNRVVFDAEFCKPSILRRPVEFWLGQHGLIGDRFDVDSNLALFHLKFLALNEVADYEELAGEVLAELGPGKPPRQELWSKGFEGLRERAAHYADPQPGLKVCEPRRAAEGMYALSKPAVTRAFRTRAHLYRAVEVREARPFAVAQPWPDLV